MLSLWRDLRLAVRAVRQSPGVAAIAILSLALGIGANVTVYSVVREMIVDDLSAQRAGFLAALSGLGLILALIGLYGSVSYATTRRTRKMGIRVALGATRFRIVWTAARDGIAVLLCGALVGIALAIAIMRTLTDLLPDGVSPWNFATLAVPALLLPAVGAIAAWTPSRRAARTDPAEALRQN